MDKMEQTEQTEQIEYHHIENEIGTEVEKLSPRQEEDRLRNTAMNMMRMTTEKYDL